MKARADREILAALLGAIEEPTLAAHVFGAVDEAHLLAVARRHRLTPLLSLTCRKTLPAALGESIRRDHVLTAARNLVLGAVAEEAISALASAGVETVLLKGIAYERTLYPGAGARPTSDVDLLVREHDRRAAFHALDGLGFEPRAAAPGFDDPDYHEVAWKRAGVEIDLHLALAPYARCAIDYDAVWRGVRPLPLGVTSVSVLAPAHAAVFHALHMAIDHFDVPGLYLVDLARLLPTDDDVTHARELARAWRCARPLATAAARAAAFQPAWTSAAAALGPVPAYASRIAAMFGGVARLPRPQQLWRKYEHFDTPWDALRYTHAQGRRHARELLERRFRHRSARERLGLATARRP